MSFHPNYLCFLGKLLEFPQKAVIEVEICLITLCAGTADYKQVFEG